VEKPNTVWAGDITYISTAQGWLYLAVVLDLASRRVCGFSEVCRGLSLNFVVPRRSYAASSADEFTSSGWWRVR
jgi:transposase InsO family protein